MNVEDDPTLLQVMTHFGVSSAALLGVGGEACVFSLSGQRVLRVHHEQTSPATVDQRTALLTELHASASSVPFAIPQVLEARVVYGRIVNVEPRLPGRPLSQALADTQGSRREDLLLAYLECSTRLQHLRLERRWYGDLCQSEPVRASSYTSYLQQRACKSLSAAGSAFAAVDAEQLATALPEPSRPSFVHLDLFPGNVLVDGAAVTAVIDFGGVPIVGDARLESLAAVSYLTPHITPHASAPDRELAQAWLREVGLAELFVPAQRWLAARWSFAREDLQLQRWCQEVLLGSTSGSDSCT